MVLLSRARLIEPMPAPEYFVSGLGRVDPVGGGNYRFLLYSNQVLTESPRGGVQRVVIVKIVGHVDGIPDIIARLMATVRSKVTTGAAILPFVN